MAARWTSLPVDGSDMPAYLALPDRTGTPGVLVCMHGPGVDGFVTAVCDRLAAEGIAAIAPDFYHRQTEPAPTPTHAVDAMLDAEALADMDAALRALGREPTVDADRLGVVGFCMGGRLAFLQAANDRVGLRTAVVFYSGRMSVAQGDGPTPFEQLAAIRVPVLGIFGARDRDPDPDDVDGMALELERAGVEHHFVSYPDAGHAFMRAEAPSRYHPEAARKAWAECLAWLHRRLARP